MRSAEHWAGVINWGTWRDEFPDLVHLIRAIEDAAFVRGHRAGAAAMREQAAGVCSHAVRYHSMKCRQALKTTRRDIADSHKSSSDTAGECASTILALPLPPGGEAGTP